jgi:DNA-binding winged helix-turn-helix (wHTH) protein
LDFRILGPLEVADHGRELALTGGKQSALLAILLLHPNEVVPTDRLIDELWGERAPPTAAKSLQVHVSRLRATFDDSGSGPDGVVLTRGGGYLIRVAPGELDRDRFERLVQEASGALGEGEPRRALELLDEAFTLWRGPPLVKNNLKTIGIDVDVKLFGKGVLFKRLGRKDEPYDMVTTGWFVDYPDPADFLSLLDGRVLDKNSYLSGAFENLAKYDDPNFNRRLVAAERLSGPTRYSTHSRLEHDMVRNGAPWIAFGNETSHDFFSARTGCRVYQPVYGMDLGALCLRKRAG